MQTIPIHTIDSFTNQPFKGNPAGVCLIDKPLSESLMQSIATELNLSETAFVVPNQDHFQVRYFSPIQEIPLCGHATLASAKVLFNKEGMDEATFITHSGVQLNCTRVGHQIGMKFPTYSLTAENNVPAELLNALGIDTFQEAFFNKETNILMLVLEDYNSVVNMNPNFNDLIASHDQINGVLVTAKGDSTYDFYSRYFWPWSGNNEDPVTGATHTFMAPYWSKVLGKRELKSFQASKRTGTMNIEILSDQEMRILGEAVIIMEGVITV